VKVAEKLQSARSSRQKSSVSHERVSGLSVYVTFRSIVEKRATPIKVFEAPSGSAGGLAPGSYRISTSRTKIGSPGPRGSEEIQRKPRGVCKTSEAREFPADATGDILITAPSRSCIFNRCESLWATSDDFPGSPRTFSSPSKPY
jgi:hypothetical protein